MLAQIQNDVNFPKRVPAGVENDFPYALLENHRGYFILVKMPGIDRGDITVDLYEESRKLVVSSRRKQKLDEKVDYWVFMVPRDGQLRASTMRLSHGVLEIAIPKNDQFVDEAMLDQVMSAG